MVPVTILILTKDEAPNLPHCLSSVASWAEAVFVLDSGSTDQTVALAEAGGATVFYRPFDNYAAQRNHALEALPITTEWVLFLDADEYVTDTLKAAIEFVVARDGGHNGYFIPFKFIFMNRWIQHGGYYPTYILRLFRKSAVQRIDRDMDEQVTVQGTTGYIEEPFVHHDRKPIQFWYEKHVRYTRFQVADLLKSDHEKHLRWVDVHTQRDKKRWVKEQIWSRIPVLLRPFLYFTYRYFLLMGFLDGRSGFIYHFSHAFLYQFMIAAVYIDQRDTLPTADERR